MMITNDIQKAIEQHLNSKLKSINLISGGCISDSSVIQTISGEKYFLKKNGNVNSNFRKCFNQLENKIENILSGKIEKPSLLHGDLWAGNYLVDENGRVCLIDPAVYYGNREADLAMTKLFGGFTKEFYDSYNELYPLEDGYEYRENIYKLYHVLNHLNLFGSGYYQQALSLIKFYL